VTNMIEKKDEEKHRPAKPQVPADDGFRTELDAAKQRLRGLDALKA
jgi:hypothetical protein